MSDIIVLAKKEFGGKTKYAEGAATTTGDVATLTATAGKDMYCGKAQVNFKSTSATGALGACKVELKANGVIKETIDVQLTSGTVGNFNGEPFTFQVTGFKVAATQIIKIEVISISNASVEASLQCWEEDTGVDPFTDFK